MFCYSEKAKAVSELLLICVLPHLSTVDSRWTVTEAFFLSDFNCYCFLLSTGSAFFAAALNFLFPFLFYLGLNARPKAKVFNTANTQQAKLWKALSEEKQNKALFSRSTQWESFAVSVFFLSVAHSHKWAQSCCLVLNLSHKHAHTHSQETEPCSLFVLFLVMIFSLSVLHVLMRFATDYTCLW